MAELYGLLVGELAPWQVAYVLLAAFASGVFHTLSGFAGGLVLSILIAPVVGVETVVPILAVSLIISAGSRAWAFRHDIDFVELANVMLPALPGIVAGALVYSALAPWLISVVLGIFLVAVVLARRPLEKSGRKVGRFGLGMAGLVFGALSGATIGGGMVLVPFLLGRGFHKENLAALFAAIGLLLNLTKSTIFLSTSVLDQHLVLLGGAIGLSTIPGTYLGYSLLRKTTVRVHTIFVETMVLTAGIVFTAWGLIAIS